MKEIIRQCYGCGYHHSRNEPCAQKGCRNCARALYDANSQCDRCLVLMNKKRLAQAELYRHKSGPRSLGVELEVLTEDFDKLHQLTEGWAFMKRDGSLTMPWGIELATGPFLLDEHRERWATLLTGKNIKALGLEVDQTCGLHVHLDMPSGSVVRRLVYFLNNPRAEGRLSAIAGRKPNDQCARTAWHWSDLMQQAEVNGSEWYPHIGHHYTMSTSTRLGNTIEIRMFASTVDYDKLMGRLEFCEAVRDWCEEESESKGHPAWKRFLAYLSRHRYEQLNSLLKEDCHVSVAS